MKVIGQKEFSLILKSTNKSVLINTVAIHFLPTTREGNVFRRICLFAGGREAETLLWTETPLAQRPPTRNPPPVLTSNGSYCSGRYTSQWNAFFF